MIARHHVEPADEDEAVVGVDVALVHLCQLDEVLDLLVRGDPADEQEIHQAVVEHPVERRPLDRSRDPRRVDGDRKHTGRAEPERIELLTVVCRVAQREIDPAGQRRELLAPERRQAEQRRIVRREIRRRGDIVVLQDAARIDR